MLTAILLEDHAWNLASEPRRQEWRLAIRDVVESHVFRTEQTPIILRLFMTPQDARFAFESPGHGVFADVTVPLSQLSPLMAIYLDTCREIGALTDGTRGKLVELDRRRKETHDAGGNLLVKALDAVGPTHDTARKLFTLLVVLSADTSAIDPLRMPHGTDPSL